MNKLKLPKLEIIFLLFYLLAMITGEYFIAFLNLQLGLVLEAMIIFALLIHSSVTRSEHLGYLLRSMTALPVVLIVSLSIPLIPLPPIYWFLLIALPLFAISIALIRFQGLSLRDVGLNLNNIPLQILVALTGILFGIAEYLILEPKPIIPTLNLEPLIISAVIIFISTGLAEELLFRGIIQRNAQKALGAGFGILYSTLLFTILNIGQNSFPDLIFIFLVGLFYGYIFYKTKSIVGIALAHGISNIMLLLILPFYILF
jgi:membrane protease YdiL (CAAX protease family)